MTSKFASMLTLGMLGAMFFSVLLVVSYLYGVMDISAVFTITIVINVFSWLFAPVINDIIYRLLYKIKFYKKSEFADLSPELYGFISGVCERNSIKFPKKVGIIEDENPTAFTYGSLPSNARLVFSKGIFTYLNKEEVEAVVAHEMGHIVHYDFLVMTIANTMVQILYEIYYFLTNSKSKSNNDNNKSPLALIGLISYIFYVIGTYALLFLSRKREYYADEFSARTTGRPNDLSTALIKIAYGMVTLSSDKKSRRLLESTRSLGIMDPHSAKGVGVVSRISGQDSGQIGKVLAYDFVSPWATIMEFGSTHPLTGKRIQKLDNMSEEMGQKKSYDIRTIINNLTIDRSRLYSGFYFGAIIHFLPNLAIAVGLILMITLGGISYLLILFGLALVIKTLYKFSNSSPEQTTLLDLMTDIYASPVRGKRVTLEGKIIGRGDSGAFLAEDMMFQDGTGLIYLDYTSKFGIFGNWFFALKKVMKLIDQEISINGWFFRGNYQMISVARIRTVSETIKSHPKLWSVLTGSVFILWGILIAG
ncbi:MAG: zinc metalloprotease HtpX [Candidatus Pacebacteria bacterium]|nr:zinc metalloprotease HtpX [Candidatus Paceibacterota bacterium]